MLARRNRARPLARCAVAVGALQGPHVRGLGCWRIGQRRHAIWIGIDQGLLAPVPFVQQLSVRQAADQPRMDKAREIDARDVPGRREHAVKVPDRFLCVRKMVRQEAAAIVAAEKSVESPQTVRLGADIQQINHQQIARLCTLHPHGPGQKMHGRQIHVPHVIGTVVILDRAARPVIGFQNEIVPGLHPHRHRNIRMPAVVDLLVFVGGLFQIDTDKRVCHSLSSPSSSVDKTEGVTAGSLKGSSNSGFDSH